MSAQFVHESVAIGEGTHIGHFSVIHEGTRIGRECIIGSGVVIHADTVVGSHVRVDDHAVLGKEPMRAKAIAIPQSSDLAPLEIGEGTLVGTGATLYRGARIGTGCLIADYASVREESTIGQDTVIGRGTVVENKVKVGERCKVETGVFIAAYSEVGNGCLIAPEVAVTNDNFMGRTEERKKHYRGITIEDGGRVGANATLLPGRTIQRDGVAASGSVVTHDIPARTIVAGVPARHFRDVPREQLLENQ